MAPSTTLITFLVRVPPSTRSVSLLGSWDNFQHSYAMQRDSRTGPEHWRGCHNFHNIICDGVGSSLVARNGGLKMGGTYWYYYKLDEDLEFHNSAEPSTTACPMLPGQLVNVLHVPFGFSSGRPRNSSTSSAVVEIRTMNPADKYMNPRPVPKPIPTRLKTSPTLPSFPFSANMSASNSSLVKPFIAPSRDDSPPTSAAGLQMHQLSRRKSSAGKSRSTSPGRDRIAGIKATIRAFRAPRSASPETEGDRGRTIDWNRGQNISQPLLGQRHANSQSPRPRPADTDLPSLESRPSVQVPGSGSDAPSNSSLPLRQGLVEMSELEPAIAPPSIHSRRRQRSQSREPSPLRRSLTLPNDFELREAIAELAIGRPGALETVREANSNLNTPQWPVTAIRTTEAEQPLTARILRLETSTPVPCLQETSAGTVCLDKRLPTLPNTPSSAYPPSAADDSPSKRLSQQLKKAEFLPFQSHFSDSTTSTQSISTGAEMVQRSHFSDWTNSALSSTPPSLHFSRINTDLDAKLFQPDEILLPELKYPPRLDSLPKKHASEETTDEEQTNSLPRSDTLATTISCSTIASTASASPLSDVFESWDSIALDRDKDAAHYDRYTNHTQTYVLPADDYNSTTATGPTKPMFQDFVNTVNNRRPPMHRENSQQHIISDDELGIVHSDSMQQLIDELSYLGGLIQE